MIFKEAGQIARNTSLAVMDGDAVVAGAVFHNYSKRDGVIEISAASTSKRWMTRPVLWEMFSFCFDQISCVSVVLRCDPSNARLGRILTAYGFDRHNIPHLRGRNGSEALFILTDAKWRQNGFHKEHENGQKFPRSNASV